MFQRPSGAEGLRRRKGSGTSSGPETLRSDVPVDGSVSPLPSALSLSLDA